MDGVSSLATSILQSRGSEGASRLILVVGGVALGGRCITEDFSSFGNDEAVIRDSSIAVERASFSWNTMDQEIKWGHNNHYIILLFPQKISPVFTRIFSTDKFSFLVFTPLKISQTLITGHQHQFIINSNTQLVFFW